MISTFENNCFVGELTFGDAFQDSGVAVVLTKAGGLTPASNGSGDEGQGRDGGGTTQKKDNGLRATFDEDDDSLEEAVERFKLHPFRGEKACI